MRPDQDEPDRELSTPVNPKPRPRYGEVMSVVHRIVSENGRDYAGTYAIVVVALLLVAGTTAFSAWIMKDVINEIFYNRRDDLIPLISGAVLAAFVIRGVASYVQAVLLGRIGNNIVARYQRRVFAHLMHLGMDFYGSQRSAQLIARINENIMGMRDILNITVTSIARDFITLVGLVAVMVYQDPGLSLIALLVGPPLIYFVNILMRRLRREARDAVLVNSRLIGAMQEATQGIAVVKAFTMEPVLTNKIAALVNDAETRANRIVRVSERTSPVTETLAGIAIAAVSAYGGYRAINAGEPPGALFSFITALLFAYDPVRRLARLQVTLERALVNARMIYELLEIEPRQRNAPGAADLDPGKGEVVFDGVHFAYQEGEEVIRGLSFAARAGQTTALVGSSGAGKSTVISLILRLYDVDRGTISVDGQDISKVTISSLRGAIAYVSQAPYLFEGTIRDNIRYGRPEATDAEVEEAARLAHADEFITGFSLGYETPVGENGANLSGGQRQRLSIARAILRDAPILLLDEATSALDNESEKRVQQALEAVMKGRTTIVVAHRLSTIIGADKIIVMEDGRIAEEGRHEQLLAANGVYARFYTVQMQKADVPALLDGGAGTEPAPRKARRRAAAKKGT